jgi:hypothetical protein
MILEGLHVVKRTVRAMAFGLVLVLAAGCVSSGTEVDPAKYEAMVIGKTTYNEAIAQLGEADTSTVDGKGERQLTYLSVKAHARAESYIPVEGLLVGGADSKAVSVVLQFDKNGILKDKATSTSKSGVNTGLINGS